MLFILFLNDLDSLKTKKANLWYFFKALVVRNIHPWCKCVKHSIIAPHIYYCFTVFILYEKILITDIIIKKPVVLNRLWYWYRCRISPSFHKFPSSMVLVLIAGLAWYSAELSSIPRIKCIRLLIRVALSDWPR